MRKNIPFISTTLIDIIAILLCGLFLLNCFFFTVITATALSYWSPIRLDFNIYGYDLLITRKSLPRTGYGIMVKNGIKIWRYQKLSRHETTERQLFNF